MEEKEVVIGGKYRKSSGTFIYNDPLYGESQFYTARCRHCGYRWQVKPGSGKNRGWCSLCNGILCGSEWCMKECVPEQARLDIESGDRSVIQKYLNTHYVTEFLGQQKVATEFMKDYLKKQNGIYIK